MKIIYTATATNEDTDEVIAHISSYSEEGLLEEMGKSKWVETIKDYENQPEVLPDDDEDAMSEEEARRQEIDSHTHPV